MRYTGLLSAGSVVIVAWSFVGSAEKEMTCFCWQRVLQSSRVIHII